MESIEQLIYRSERWPWKWFKVFRTAASLCEKEVCKSNLLKEEYRLLKIEANELHNQRLNDAERHQSLRDDYQLLKHELTEMDKKRMDDLMAQKAMALEIEKLKEERSKLGKEHSQMKDGVTTLFEYIRRNQVVANNGRTIPEMPRFPNVFRK